MKLIMCLFAVVSNFAYASFDGSVIKNNILYESIQGSERSIITKIDRTTGKKIITYGRILNYEIDGDTFYSDYHGFGFVFTKSPIGKHCVLMSWPDGSDTLCQYSKVTKIMKLKRTYLSTSGNGRSLKLKRSSSGLKITYYDRLTYKISKYGKFFSDFHDFTFTVNASRKRNCVVLFWPNFGSDELCLVK